MIEKVIVRIVTHDGKVRELATTPIQIEQCKCSMLDELYILLLKEELGIRSETTQQTENKS